MKMRALVYGMLITFLFMSQFYAFSLIKSYLNMDFNAAIFYQNVTFVLFWGGFFTIILLSTIYEGVTQWKK